MNSGDIGKRIVTLREKRGFSQKDFAEMIPVSPATLSRWENGLITPPLSQLDRICEILNIPLEDIFAGDRAEYANLYNRFFRLRLVFVFSTFLLIMGLLFILLPKYKVISSQEKDNGDFCDTIIVYARPVFFISERSAYSYGSKLAKKYSNDENYEALEVIFVKKEKNLYEESNEFFSNVYFLSNRMD